MGCEELFGVIEVIWVRFLYGLAAVANCKEVVESVKKCAKRQLERVGRLTRSTRLFLQFDPTKTSL